MPRFFSFNRARIEPIEEEQHEEIPQSDLPLPVRRLTTEQEIEAPLFLAQTINSDELRRLGIQEGTLDIPTRRQKKTTNYYTEKPRTILLTEYRNNIRQTNPIIEQLYNYMFTTNDTFKNLLEYFNLKINGFNDNELSNIVTLYIHTTTDKRYLTFKEISVFISLVYLHIYKHIQTTNPKLKYKLFFVFYNICSLFRIHKNIIRHLIEKMKLIINNPDIIDIFLQYLLALLLFTPINILLSFDIEPDTPDDIHLLLNELGLLNVLERFFVDNHKFTLDFLSISIESPQFIIQNGGSINKKIKKLKKYK